MSGCTLPLNAAISKGDAERVIRLGYEANEAVFRRGRFHDFGAGALHTGLSERIAR